MLTGFGMTFDIKRGTVRNWYVGKDGVKRWADNDRPVELLSECPMKPENNDNHVNKNE